MVKHAVLATMFSLGLAGLGAAQAPATTPADGTGRVSRLAKAPRGLKEPVCWKSSNLNASELAARPSEPETLLELSHRVTEGRRRDADVRGRRSEAEINRRLHQRC